MKTENKTPHETNSRDPSFSTNSFFFAPEHRLTSDDSFPFGANSLGLFSGVPTRCWRGGVGLRVWEAVPSRSPTAPFFAPVSGERGLPGWYAQVGM